PAADRGGGPDYKADRAALEPNRRPSDDRRADDKRRPRPGQRVTTNKRPTPAPPEEKPLSPTQAMAQAQSLEAAGNWKDARDLYEKLAATPNKPYAGEAAYH